MGEAKINKKTLVGNVLSAGKMDKTVVVSIERLTKHPFYGKYVKRRVRYMAHDVNNECSAGDKVMIVESPPMSKMKRWRVKEILEKAK